MYELHFDTGCVVKVTGNHMLMLEDGSWKRADSITEQDNVKWVGQQIGTQNIK